MGPTIICHAAVEAAVVVTSFGARHSRAKQTLCNNVQNKKQEKLKWKK